MKKFIILVAAVTATVACTKSETAQTPEKAISFEVAKYATKAASYNSLLDETASNAAGTAAEAIADFTTNAWFHTDGYAAQHTMTDQKVAPNDATNPTEWNTVGRTYYWPKTGSINFFSFAGTPAPTAKEEGSITYSAVNVNRYDNILVADAAYGYKENTASVDPYGQNSVTKGVPTLFHHMLAKVKFDVILDATATEPGYTWTATITSASINVPSVGTLAVSFTEPGTTPAIAPVTTAGWTSVGTPQAYDKVSGDVVLTTKGEKKSDTGNAEGSAAGKAAELIAESTVIPHTLTDDVTFTMTYTLSSQYGTETPVTETVPVSATKLTAFAPTIGAWAMNTKYTYHIIIKPNEPILFDPAVETWVAETNEPVYTY